MGIWNTETLGDLAVSTVLPEAGLDRHWSDEVLDEPGQHHGQAWMAGEPWGRGSQPYLYQHSMLEAIAQANEVAVCKEQSPDSRSL